MSRMLATGLLVMAFAVAMVQGHAKLISPVAWNPNPSKTSECGGATPTIVFASWSYNTLQTIQWQTVAGDGVGYICAVLDSTGSTNPSGVNPSTCTSSTPSCASNTALNTPCLLAPLSTNPTGNPNPTTTVGAVVNYNFQPPVVTCDKCTLAVYSSSSWFACTTVAIAATAPPTQTPPTAGPSQCATPTDLTFCTMFNGLSLALPTDGQTLEALDTLVENTYNANLASKLVFNNPTASTCPAIYERFICYANFQICQTTVSACQDACTNAMNACGGLQSEHSLLYVCTSLPQTNCNDDKSVSQLSGQVLPGQCCTPGQTAGIVIGVLIGVALIVGAVVYVVMKKPAFTNRFAAKKASNAPKGMI